MSDTTSSQIYDDPSTDDDELVREAPYAAAAPYLIATTPEPSLSLNTGLHTPSPKKITSMYGNSVLLRNSPIREAVLKTAGTRSRDASSAE